MKLIVITKVPDLTTAEGHGNLASPMGDLFQHRGLDYAPLRVDPALQMSLRVPVFELGEIIVCDADGREIGGRGRKPSKWSVSIASFDFAQIELAIDRARRLTEGGDGA